MTEKKSFIIGVKEAPVHIELYINVACPGSAHFFKIAEPILKAYVKEKKAYISLKLWDKPKIGLLNGTLIHLSIDYSNEHSLDTIKNLLTSQNEWNSLNSEELKLYISEKYKLQERVENTEISLAVSQEVLNQGILYLPAFVVNGTLYPLGRDYIEKDIIHIIEQVINQNGVD